MDKIYNIPAFLKYVNNKEPKSDLLHIIDYASEQDTLLQSKPVCIDFYLLALKTNPDIPQSENMSDSYAYFCRPDRLLEWNFSTSFTGYSMFVHARLLDKYVKEYSFVNYNNHEALFLTHEEKEIIQDLFQKANAEYQKGQFSKEVIVSYASLILSYVQVFYKRQFDSRSKIYNKVVADFYEELDKYFNVRKDVIELPSVTFFAEKANLSPNYFGDLIKHFTGQSPQDHIHQYIVRKAKEKLRQTDLSVSEIAYSLGFDYPTYFTRFFRKETGITPTIFRNQ
ncbi:MAG: helix-turn-helix domain-containing protein [Chitinophagaceae bacterium]